MHLFLGAGVARLIEESVMASAPGVGPWGIKLKEEGLASVPKLEKDTLMPKDLSE